MKHCLLTLVEHPPHNVRSGLAGPKMAPEEGAAQGTSGRDRRKPRCGFL